MKLKSCTTIIDNDGKGLAPMGVVETGGRSFANTLSYADLTAACAFIETPAFRKFKIMFEAFAEDEHDDVSYCTIEYFPVRLFWRWGLMRRVVTIGRRTRVTFSNVVAADTSLGDWLHVF